VESWTNLKNVVELNQSGVVNNMEWPLNLLKYAGLLLAAVSSIWGTTADVTKKVNGRKRLTRGGYILISLTVFGLMVSIVSNIVEDHLKTIAQEDNIKAELQRTNRIILAGQPLTSLRLKWLFNVDKQFSQEFTSRTDVEVKEMYNTIQGGYSAQNISDIHKECKLFPFVTSCLSDSVTTSYKEFLVLMALDNDENAILSFGNLSDDAKWNGGPFTFLKKKRLKISGGITFKLDFDQFGNAGRELTRPIRNEPWLKKEKDSLFVTWELDPSTFQNCVDRQNPNSSLTANLPTIIRIVILYDIENLPFSSDNLALTQGWNVWGDISIDTKETERHCLRMFSKSFVELVPNGLKEQVARYNFKRLYAKKVPSLEPEDDDLKCGRLMLQFER